MSSAKSTPEPTDAQLRDWVESGNYAKLESAIMQGKGGPILRKADHYKEMSRFLDSAIANNAKLKLCQDAIKEGDLRRVKNIVDRKHLVTARNENGRTLLHTAIDLSKDAIALYFIQAMPECVKIVDKRHRTPLHYAAAIYGADSEVYCTLVKAGADVNAKDKFNCTPIDYLDKPSLLDRPSFNHGQGSMEDEHGIHAGDDQPDNLPSMESVEVMLAAGDLEALEHVVLEGFSYLLHDKESSNENTMEFLDALPKYETKMDAIHLAVKEGDVRRVRALINRAKLAAARDQKGATPIHNAVLYNQTDTLRYLIAKYPATINLTDFKGRSPMHYAAADPNAAYYLKLLQKAGADAFIEDKVTIYLWSSK